MYLSRLLFCLLGLFAFHGVLAAPALVSNSLDQPFQEWDKRSWPELEKRARRTSTTPSSSTSGPASAPAPGRPQTQPQPAPQSSWAQVAGGSRTPTTPGSNTPAPPPGSSAPIPPPGSHVPAPPGAGAPALPAPPATPAGPGGPADTRPANAPKISQNPTDPNKPNRYSYSGTGQTYANAATSAKDGYNDMTRLHNNQQTPPNGQPSIVSALNTPDGSSRLDSSYKGGFPAEANKDPKHVQAPQTQQILDACSDKYGGKHGNGANCGEIRNADGYFKDNPSATHIPEGSDWAAHGQVRDGSVPKDGVAACTGGGTHNWGCKQFKDMAMTPGIAKPPPPPPKVDEDGWETVTKKGKGKRDLEEEEFLVLLGRALMEEFGSG